MTAGRPTAGSAPLVEGPIRSPGAPIDISMLVHPGTPEWPGDTPYSCGWTWDMAAGASVQVSAITMSPHVGTHADAPIHVKPGGTATEALPLPAFLGPAYLLTVDGTPRDLELDDTQLRTVPAGTERLLLRSGQSIASGSFPDDWPALSAPAAHSMARGGLRLLGVDAPSVDRRESTALATHHALFDGGAQVLENLDLRELADGHYLLVALPLRLHGLDASPVRAVLYDQPTPLDSSSPP